MADLSSDARIQHKALEDIRELLIDCLTKLLSRAQAAAIHAQRKRVSLSDIVYVLSASENECYNVFTRSEAPMRKRLGLIHLYPSRRQIRLPVFQRLAQRAGVVFMSNRLVRGMTVYPEGGLQKTRMQEGEIVDYGFVGIMNDIVATLLYDLLRKAITVMQSSKRKTISTKDIHTVASTILYGGNREWQRPKTSTRKVTPSPSTSRRSFSMMLHDLAALLDTKMAAHGYKMLTPESLRRPTLDLYGNEAAELGPPQRKEIKEAQFRFVLQKPGTKNWPGAFVAGGKDGNRVQLGYIGALIPKDNKPWVTAFADGIKRNKVRSYLVLAQLLVACGPEVTSVYAEPQPYDDNFYHIGKELYRYYTEMGFRLYKKDASKQVKLQPGNTLVDAVVDKKIKYQLEFRADVHDLVKFCHEQIGVV